VGSVILLSVILLGLLDSFFICIPIYISYPAQHIEKKTNIPETEQIAHSIKTHRKNAPQNAHVNEPLPESLFLLEITSQSLT
jgi:hypothetical protein